MASCLYRSTVLLIFLNVSTVVLISIWHSLCDFDEIFCSQNLTLASTYKRNVFTTVRQAVKTSHISPAAAGQPAMPSTATHQTAEPERGREVRGETVLFLFSLGPPSALPPHAVAPPHHPNDHTLSTRTLLPPPPTRHSLPSHYPTTTAGTPELAPRHRPKI
jgi:hypothetical protein